MRKWELILLFALMRSMSCRKLINIKESLLAVFLGSMNKIKSRRSQVRDV